MELSSRGRRREKGGYIPRQSPPLTHLTWSSVDDLGARIVSAGGTHKPFPFKHLLSYINPHPPHHIFRPQSNHEFYFRPTHDHIRRGLRRDTALYRW